MEAGKLDDLVCDVDGVANVKKIVHEFGQQLICILKIPGLFGNLEVTYNQFCQVLVLIVGINNGNAVLDIPDMAHRGAETDDAASVDMQLIKLAELFHILRIYQLLGATVQRFWKFLLLTDVIVV